MSPLASSRNVTKFALSSMFMQRRYRSVERRRALHAPLHVGMANTRHTLSLGLAPTDEQRPYLSLDVTPEGAQERGDLAAGDLIATSGNLYLYVDGVEYGSLLLTWSDGQPQITLGRYDEDTEDWQPTNPVTDPVVVA